MADVLGIAKSTYASYETGYRQPPIDALIKIANFFNISLDTLVNRHYRSGIDLDQIKGGNYRFYIDGKALTKDELKAIVAFVKVKRGLS